ncbi:hypothetical protein PSR30_13590 [Pectobacterium carotovorum subsp. carotovorum]|uniref:hypothetical protein n=1 Tax=Pectobacterium carotovorum TaxID=554 RepID=UPI000582656A|nr:hypothetical protein [Pectobacterium carotovorum]KHS84629.1 hypothetical protein RC84_10310 [Pectobacterium carotovorum subsp. carotovorum]QQK71702.1 hypothetical protein HG702_09430 [Pectobacterium versatile]WDF97458.1 hypothetical protein PSR30_13590 [Pectobacterium carotovorum subsp. carotovorum]
MKCLRIWIATALLFCTNAHAVVVDQQWGDWYGTSGGMEFSINSRNASNEVLTLKCANQQLVVRFSIPAENYTINSVEGAQEVYLSINSKKYELDNIKNINGEIPAAAVFDVLKQTKNSDVLRFTSFQSGESKDFSASGLNEALKDITWQDCINQ